MSGSTSTLPPAQARLAALNRLKAKDKFTGRPEAGTSRDGALTSANAYVNKRTEMPSSARDMAAQQKAAEEPLKPNPGLVS